MILRRRKLLLTAGAGLVIPRRVLGWQIPKRIQGLYFEATLDHGFTSGFDAGYGAFGIASASALLVMTGGDWANGAAQVQEAETVGWFSNTLGSGRALGDPNRIDSVEPDLGVGTVYAMAVNTALERCWIRNVSAAGGWAGTGLLPDPTTGVSGFDYTANISGGVVYAFVGASQRNDTNYGQMTINLGGTAFAGAVPTGYLPWGAADTLNPSDKSVNLTMTNGNLTISTAGMGSSGTYVGQLARSIGFR